MPNNCHKLSTAILPIAAALWLSACNLEAEKEPDKEPEVQPSITPSVTASPAPSLPVFERLHLSLKTEDATELFSRHPFDNERMLGSLSLSGNEAVQDLEVGVRFRGNSTRLEPKKGFNIQFNDDQGFLWGGDRINARAMWRDPSFIREHLSYWLFDQLEIHAPQTQYYELWINDSFEGLYSHFERIDRRFLRARSLNRNGTLVRDQLRNAGSPNPCGSTPEQSTNVRSAFSGLNFASISREDAITCLESKFDSRRADWDGLLDLLLWLEASEAGDDFADELAERVDLDGMIDFLVAHLLIGDRDSIWGNDYWLYKDHQQEGAKWLFIPYDKNLTFGSHWRSGEAATGESGYGGGNLYFPYEYDMPNTLGANLGGNLLFELLMATPELRQKVQERTLELLASDLWLIDLPQELQRVAQLVAPYGQAKGIYEQEFNHNTENHMNLWGQHQDHVQQVSEFHALRTQFLLHYVANDFRLATNNVSRHQANWTAEQAYQSGQRVWLQDDYGFVLAQLELQSNLPKNTEIKLLVRPTTSEVSNALTMEYELYSSQPLVARLHLYYRNDCADEIPCDRDGVSQIKDAEGNAIDWLDENWYRGGLVSVGNQWQMQLHAKPELAITNQQAAPLINRLSADIQLPARQRTLIWAKLPNLTVD